MFENLKEKIIGASAEKKNEKKLIKENFDVSRYETNVLSIGDSAYTCSMGAKICYGLKVDKSYAKNKAHIARIVGMGHDSVSAHSNVIALIKINGNSDIDFLNILPAIKFMNVVHLQNTIKAEMEDGEDKIENYMLVSGTARAFRYFFMTYDFYNEDISNLALQFIKIAADSYEKEFFEKLLPQTNLFKDYLPKFNYLAPLDWNLIEEKNPETGEIEEVLDINDDSPSIHFKEIDGERIDIIYTDNIIKLFLELKNIFKNTDNDILIKALFDTCICTIRMHDYSRAISQQVNRHMSGISQESQRYVDYSEAQFVDPTLFNQERYDKSTIYKVQIDGHEISGKSGELGQKLQSVYPQLREQGMLAQDARSYLPFNVKTKALHTFTLTNYIHFIKVRTAKAAQEEIRRIAKEMSACYKLALNKMAEDIEESGNEELSKEARVIEVGIRKWIEKVESKD